MALQINKKTINLLNDDAVTVCFAVKSTFANTVAVQIDESDFFGVNPSDTVYLAMGDEQQYSLEFKKNAIYSIFKSKNFNNKIVINYGEVQSVTNGSPNFMPNGKSESERIEIETPQEQTLRNFKQNFILFLHGQQLDYSGNNTGIVRNFLELNDIKDPKVRRIYTQIIGEIFATLKDPYPTYVRNDHVMEDIYDNLKLAARKNNRYDQNKDRRIQQLQESLADNRDELETSQLCIVDLREQCLVKDRQYVAKCNELEDMSGRYDNAFKARMIQERNNDHLSRLLRISHQDCRQMELAKTEKQEQLDEEIKKNVDLKKCLEESRKTCTMLKMEKKATASKIEVMKRRILLLENVSTEASAVILCVVNCWICQ